MSEFFEQINADEFKTVMSTEVQEYESSPFPEGYHYAQIMAVTPRKQTGGRLDGEPYIDIFFVSIDKNLNYKGNGRVYFKAIEWKAKKFIAATKLYETADNVAINWLDKRFVGLKMWIKVKSYTGTDGVTRTSVEDFPTQAELERNGISQAAEETLSVKKETQSWADKALEEDDLFPPPDAETDDLPFDMN